MSAVAEAEAPLAIGYRPEWMETRSRLLDYLPGIFSEGEEASFIGRYLMIFQTMLDSCEATIGHLPDYFAPDTAPDAFLPWLASWVGLIVDEGWPVERRRAVLKNAMELHRWRGTVRGMREHLLRYTGVEPEIVERGAGLTLGSASKLGHQTVLGRGDRPFHFTVILRVADPTAYDRGRIRAIVEAQRPAHTTYALFILPLDGEPTGDGDGNAGWGGAER